MNMVSLHSEDDYRTLELAPWGIPTPSKDSTRDREWCLDEAKGSEVPASQQKEMLGLDFILMPGVAFDDHGGRLGHGKGFYDFFLHRYQNRMTRYSDSAQKMPTLGKS